jgi:hypothetical protein
MEKEEKIDEAALQQLRDFGFPEENILIALRITTDIEKASEIALKLGDEGPDADLSAYLPSPPPASLKAQLLNEYVTTKFTRTKMIFVVNGELKMGKGKICAQVGHAVIGAFVQIEQEARYDERARVRL